MAINTVYKSNEYTVTLYIIIIFWACKVNIRNDLCNKLLIKYNHIIYKAFEQYTIKYDIIA